MMFPLSLFYFHDRQGGKVKNMNKANLVYKLWCPPVRLFVPSCRTLKRMNWRPLVEERIAKIP